VTQPARKILILDPSPVFRRTLKEVIQTSESHVQVTEAGDILQAECILKKRPADVVFQEIAFPRNNGIHFISTVRRLSPKARIVVLSSHDGPEYEDATLREGADYFLSKERSGGLRLLDVIRKAVRGAGSGSPTGGGENNCPAGRRA
jgi:DNA-binding NarL/FixJ family response regulator